MQNKTSDTKDTSLKSNDGTPTERVSKSSSKLWKNMENHPVKSNSNVATVSSMQNKVAYKLSLNKATTEMMTRKRMRSKQAKSQIQAKRLKVDSIELELDTPAEESVQNSNCDIDEPLSGGSGTTNEENEPKSNSPVPLLQIEIDELTNKIAKTEKHHQKVSELQLLIVKWREAGILTIEQLEKALGEDALTILAHNNIDPALFNLNLSE